MDPPPSFRAEIYFLMAKLLDNGPCKEAAEVLRKDIEAHALVPPRYDWLGKSHQKTFRDMEEEFGQVPNEFLLSKCFELCSRLTPGTSSVRSLLRRDKCNGATSNQQSNMIRQLSQHQVGKSDKAYNTNWHTQLAKNMKLLRRTFGHLSSVYCLIFDRSGSLVLTGSDDMLVKCWSFFDGRLIHTFRGASSEISDLAVSHDNKLLAAGSCDKVIRVWELHTATPVAVLTKHTGTITAINFCPFFLNSDGGRYLASTSGDGTVSFWRYQYDKHGHTDFDDQPTRYHEKIRPGSTQMICASFSPGGVFFVVGSADHNVRVYQMNGPDGPVRILEEEAHDDRVDSIQWCNTPHELRFLSGSRDGTARIWTFAQQQWRTLVLNMKTGDNQEPSKNVKPTGDKPSTSSSSRSAANRPVQQPTNNGDNSDNPSNDANLIVSNNRKMRSVTMVAWSADDALAITAVSDLTLKIWDAHRGNLLSTLSGHEDEIFVLEPHPHALNLLLTAAHDGHIMVWDLETSTRLFKHRNMIEDQVNIQGHGPVFDAKWSKDGATICASDSHGHILFIGHGSSERFSKNPTELFFHTDFRPLLRDSFHNVVDEQTQLPPHLLPPPFLVDSEGDPYPAPIQRLVRGRENMSDHDALVPLGPEPSFQAPHQPQEQQQQQQQQPEELESEHENDNQAPENPEERLNRFRSEMIRNLPNSSRQSEQMDQSAAAAEEPLPAAEQQQPPEEQQEQQQQQQQPENNVDIRVGKLVILKENFKKREIEEQVAKSKVCSAIEASLFITESTKEAFDHDYSRPTTHKEKSNKKKASRGSRSRPDDEQEEDEEEEENTNNGNANNGDETTSDCSLDESDFASAESTTDVSSEHSDWGSDQSGSKQPQPLSTPSKKRSSPKNKKKRNAAQRCREKLQFSGGDIGEEFIPSPWLSDSMPRKTPYFPQIGDVLMYFKTGHQKYIDLVELRKAYKLNMREQQWMRKKNLDDAATMVRVADINFEIRPPRLCVLKLAILNQSSSEATGETFTIKYHDMNDVVDFLVLYQSYNSYKGKHWKKGDRIRCQIDDAWWKGTVHKTDLQEHKSPFLSIYVHWDNGDNEYLSPWDLEYLDNDSMEIKDGESVTVDQLKRSLYIPTSEEWNNIGRESECTRISEALATIMELAIAEPFNFPVDLTNYPEYMVDVEYPMDLSLIKARVDHHFYRRIDSIKHDLKYIALNAACFNQPRSDIVRNAKTISKVAIEIVSETNKTKDDVSAIYHRLVESFDWSSSDDSDGDEDDDQDQDQENDPRRKTRSKKKSSPPNLNPKKWKHDCNELLSEMAALPCSVPFREPVSENDFPDYNRVIATPMDLSSVRESLHIGDYNSPMDFQKDIRLIFKNSKEYNTNSRSKALAMTFKMEEWFEQRVSDLISDWRNTSRRLTLAKRKHKAKRQDQSPRHDYKGKGKGKGKGQSNKIKSRNNRSSSDDDNDDDDDDEDFNAPKPGPSSSVAPRVKSSRSIPVPTTAAPPLRNAMTEAGRRTSSRPSKPPLRFQDEDTDDDDHSPKKTTPTKEEPSSSNASTAGAAAKTSPAGASKKKDEVPKKAAVKRKSNEAAIKVEAVIKDEDLEDEEEEPLVKRASKKAATAAEGSSDEDVPLAVRKKAPPAKSLHSRPSRPPRPTRPSRRYAESEDESEDDQHLQRRRQVSKRSRRPSSSSSPQRRNSRRSSKKASRNNRPSKRPRFDAAADVSEESESESSDDEEDKEEEELPKKRHQPARRSSPSPGRPARRGLRGGGRNVAPHDDEEDDVSEEEIMPQRKRQQLVQRSSRLRHASTSSSISTLPRRRNVARPTYFEEDEESDERRISNNRRPTTRNARGRKKAQIPDDDEDEESTPAAADSSEEGSGQEDIDGESDDEPTSREEAYLKKKKKSTVTSRGRVSKPNPRNI
jgi:bromodomain and WD repeat domain-containing protein 1/3